MGAQFGTLLVVKNKIPFQVSTFRGKNKGYSLNILDDVALRDFTINGLVYDPIKHKVIDLVQAKEDIRKKTIRTITEAPVVFTHDPLRLIRAVRLAANLGFKIEKSAFCATKAAAAKIKRVSLERIREELISIFTGPNPGKGLKLLDESGLLKYILPNVDKLKGVQQPQAFHPEGDVFSHTLLMLQQLKRPSLLLTFACLFHDIGKPQTFQMCDRIRFSGHDKAGAELTDKILRGLKFSNKDREEIVLCVENHMRMMEAPKMRDATLKRLLARPTFEEELELHRLDCIASHGDLTIWRFLNKKYKQVKNRPIIPGPILDGYELIKIGFTPGPIFGKIHKQMVDMQLEGKLKTKAEARKWLRNKLLRENKNG